MLQSLDMVDFGSFGLQVPECEGGERICGACIDCIDDDLKWMIDIVKVNLLALSTFHYIIMAGYLFLLTHGFM